MKEHATGPTSRGQHRATRLASFLAAALAVVVVNGAAPSAASTVDVYRFFGMVTDPLGRPLSDVSIFDGGQAALTDAAGDYELWETSTGTYDLFASRADLVGAEETVDVFVPADTRVDFELLYRLAGELSSSLISSVDSAAVLTLTITSPVPQPAETTPGGSCVITAPHNGSPSSATLIDRHDETSTWTLDVTVPAGTPEGRYSLDYWAEECTDGTLLAAKRRIFYEIDNTPPSVAQPAPTGWTQPDTTLSIAVADNVEVSPSSHFLLDGISIDAALTPGRLSAEITDLSSGTHSVTAVVNDLAGNHTKLSWTFDVDPEPPALINPQPVGNADTCTPLLAVQLEDTGSGINPAAVTLNLSDGLRSQRLAATYDSATGWLSYQIPDYPQGVGLGDAPLASGHYIVTARGADAAGNLRELVWSFDVDTVSVLGKALTEAPS